MNLGDLVHGQELGQTGLELSTFHVDSIERHPLDDKEALDLGFCTLVGMG